MDSIKALEAAKRLAEQRLKRQQESVAQTELELGGYEMALAHARSAAAQVQLPLKEKR